MNGLWTAVQVRVPSSSVRIWFQSSSITPKTQREQIVPTQTELIGEQKRVHHPGLRGINENGANVIIKIERGARRRIRCFLNSTRFIKRNNLNTMCFNGSLSSRRTMQFGFNSMMQRIGFDRFYFVLSSVRSFWFVHSLNRFSLSSDFIKIILCSNITTVCCWWNASDQYRLVHIICCAMKVLLQIRKLCGH
jgi:hypothetical protein